jgi:small subunit ribosomal protein S15
LLDPQLKNGIVQQYRTHETDTGSTEVQVAILTERIKQLTRHMTASGHDFHSKRALLKLVGQRRRLLSYLNRSDVEGYKKLIKSLGLRK